MQRRKLLQYSALGFGAVATALLVGWWQVDGPGAPDMASGRPVPLTVMDFALTDHEGQSVGPEMLIGRPSLVFFGFTWCPQVCPTTLADISYWLDGLGPEAEALNTILITVDPELDTVDACLMIFLVSMRGWSLCQPDHFGGQRRRVGRETLGRCRTVLKSDHPSSSHEA